MTPAATRIGIIGFTSMRYMPYLRKYTQILESRGQPYDVIYFDRDAETISEGNQHVFSARCFGAPAWAKVVPFVRFQRFVRKVVKKNRYERLIVLTTLPAILLSDLLLRRYAGRYVLDYRDVSYEHFAPYRWLLGRISRSAAMTAISSPAFAKLLPAGNLVVSHNISPELLAGGARAPRAALRDANRIVVTYLGHIGYLGTNRFLVDKLADVPGIELRITGVGCDNLRKAAARGAAANVRYHGRFEPEEKEQFYLETDFVASTHGYQSDAVRLPLSNKLYEAACYGRPLIVCRNTLLQEYVERYALGLAVDLQRDDLVRAIRGYVAAFDAETFAQGCRRFLDDVRQDEQVFEERFVEFLQPAS